MTVGRSLPQTPRDSLALPWWISLSFRSMIAALLILVGSGVDAQPPGGVPPVIPPGPGQPIGKPPQPGASGRPGAPGQPQPPNAAGPQVPQPGQPPAGPGVGPANLNPANPQPGQPAQPRGGPAGANVMSQDKIERAIKYGVDYLLSQQNRATGSWGSGDGTKVGSDGGWIVGHAALIGLALYECGVARDNPQLKAAASVVRQGTPLLDSTYEVALAILFLDRMNEPKDRDRIQQLAVRLILGQTATGGWSYRVPKRDRDVSKVLQALRAMSPPPTVSTFSYRERPSSLGLCIKMSDDIRPKPPAKKASNPAEIAKTREAALRALPASMRQYAVFREGAKMPESDAQKMQQEPINGTTDNSNTHFAIIGLWTARKYDVPTERSFGLVSKRFRTSQGGAGGWDYRYSRNGGDSKNAMTCVSLLALAIGHALAIDKDAGPRPEQDPMIIKAFGLLGQRVGAPTGRTDNRPTVKEAGGLYYLWALERIAVLYDVRTLDNKDWYLWGAEILVGHQQEDGSWPNEKEAYAGESEVLNTAFAILFLRRANLTPDLSRRLISDSSALTASVSKPTPPAPTPPRPTPPAPTPPPKATTPPAPKPEPPAPKPTTPVQPVVAQPAPVVVPPTAIKKSNDWLWIVLLIVAILLLVGCAIGVMMIKKKEPAESEPKRGKVKKRGREKTSVDEEKQERSQKKRATRPD